MIRHTIPTDILDGEEMRKIKQGAENGRDHHHFTSSFNRIK